MTINKKILQINPKDNVVVALDTLIKGSVVSFNDISIEVMEDIPVNHKMALETITSGATIYMYGVPVGIALIAIEKGGLLTVDNVKHTAAP